MSRDHSTPHKLAILGLVTKARITANVPQNRVETVKKGIKKIGLYGISFKEGTDDLRFSGGLEIAEKLLGKGYELKIFDSNVSISKLMGKNKEFIFSKLPHINEILKEDIKSFLDEIELLVIINKDKYLNDLRKYVNKELIIIDFVGTDLNELVSDYEGICW